MVIMASQQRSQVHLTHWGAAEIESDGQRLTSVRPWREDPDPSRILENLAGAHRHPTRIDQPYVRQGWLEHGPGPAPRGRDGVLTGAWAAAVARGCRLVSVSPLRSDTDRRLGAEWIAPVPGTDAALMLALCHVLDAEGLADRDFLDRYTVGYPRFIGYVRGESDGVPKTPAWAAALTGVPAERIRVLARQLTAGRTMVTVSWSLQRAEHGEQPVWLGLVLAAMLGQIGLPGGGFGHGYGSTSDIGLARRLSAPRLPQGPNGIDSYIPVARIADMLLQPGTEYDYNGQRRRYPDVKLVYWCGGNPFHHHQHLARLREALARPQTVVVHDPFWPAPARPADLVLPSTMSL